MNLTYFVILLVIIFIIIYIYNKNIENFNSNSNFNSILTQSYEKVNYNTKKQNCNELTFDPNNCYVETILPSNTNVCTDKSLLFTPIDNNNKKYEKNNKEIKRKTKKLTNIENDLLSNFNEHKNYDDDLFTEVKSLNSLENDIMSNY